jgi:hypothetical protein
MPGSSDAARMRALGPFHRSFHVPVLSGVTPAVEGSSSDAAVGVEVVVDGERRVIDVEPNGGRRRTCGLPLGAETRQQRITALLPRAPEQALDNREASSYGGAHGSRRRPRLRLSRRSVDVDRPDALTEKCHIGTHHHAPQGRSECTTSAHAGIRG